MLRDCWLRDARVQSTFPVALPALGTPCGETGATMAAPTGRSGTQTRLCLEVRASIHNLHRYLWQHWNHPSLSTAQSVPYSTGAVLVAVKVLLSGTCEAYRCLMLCAFSYLTCSHLPWAIRRRYLNQRSVYCKVPIRLARIPASCPRAPTLFRYRRLGRGDRPAEDLSSA